MRPFLYLVPSPLSTGPRPAFINPVVHELMERVKFWVVENEKTARHSMRNMGFSGSFADMEFMVLDEHTSHGFVEDIIEHIRLKGSACLMSEAGMPALADPGEELIYLAHRNDFRVIPLPGPSAIIMSLVGSGLNAEKFCFNGYLPVPQPQRIRKIKQMEQCAAQEHSTQIFMETPYRCRILVEDLLKALHDSTLLCIAMDLMNATEEIKTQTVGEWKKKPPVVHKRLCVFLIGMW